MYRFYKTKYSINEFMMTGKSKFNTDLLFDIGDRPNQRSYAHP